MTADSQLFIWGHGSFGEFFTPHRVKAANDIDIKDFKLSKGGLAMILTKNGDLYSWGENQFGQLGQGDFKKRKAPIKINSLGSKQVTDVFLGHQFVMALGVNLPQSEYERVAMENS